MADKRKGKKKKELETKPEDDKPSKLEYDVAKYLRNKLPQKRTTLLGHKVDYFISAKAIDLLLDSKWATNTDKVEAIFTTRDSVIDFLENLLRHKFFHRARKIIVRNEPKKKKTDQDAIESSAPEDKEKKKAKKEKAKKEKSEKDDSEEKGEKPEKEKKPKEKKKVKLDMHLEQVYVDGNEPFVWIYDPIPMKAWLIGLGLVFGAIAICLFPLWPRVVRNYVYYLSIAAAGFLFFIISLAIVRVVVFCVVWAVTFGKHHFWLLPNLTEDVGFFASFWPLYQYDYMGGKEDDEDEKESSTKQLTKKDSEEEVQVEKEVEASDSQNSEDGEEEDAQIPTNGSDNGFEILDSKDLVEEEQHQGTAQAT